MNLYIKPLHIFTLFTILFAHRLCEAGYIDNHVHVALFGHQSKGYISKAMRKGFKFSFYEKIFGVTEEMAMKEGDQIIFKVIHQQVRESKYIDQVVILALDQVYAKTGELKKDQTQIYVPNSFVYEQTQKYKTQLFGASVHPYRKDALKELEKVKKEGAVLIKLIPAIHLFDPSDPVLITYYKKLKELHLPLLIHMDDEQSFAYDGKEFSGPKKLRLALDLGVTVICAHAASNGGTKGQNQYFEELSQMATHYPNLYADISALLIFKTRFNHLQKVISDPRWKGKLIYGSDWPLSHQLLSSPLYYFFKLGPIDSLKLAFTSNTWDRDVLIKKAFGTPESIFVKTKELLLSNPKLNGNSTVFKE